MYEKKYEDLAAQAEELVEEHVDAMEKDEEPDEDGRILERVYLGSVLQITPSGKYYMPFANSNVERCPHCGGTGEVRRQTNRKLEKLHKQRCKLADNLKKTGWSMDRILGHPKYEKLTKRFYRWRTVECLYCNGLGSIEAHFDEVFNEALDEAAEKHGCWIAHGEGDALDVFLVREVENEEQDEEVDSEREEN